MDNLGANAAETSATLKEYLPNVINAIDKLESYHTQQDMNLDLLSQTIEGLHLIERAMSMLNEGSLLSWLAEIDTDLVNADYVKAVHTCSVYIKPALKMWWSKHTNKNTTLIIFSKDRALQLDGTLRSFFVHSVDAERAEVIIIYKASNAMYSGQYQRLMKEYPNCRFVEEGNFKDDLLTSVKQNEFVLFSVDDNMFIRSFSLGELERLLSAHTQAIGVSLRLGRNTTYCYPVSSPQSLPRFTITEDPAILEYVWSDAANDFGYPLEVSSSFYRSNDLMPVLENTDYRNPNELEVQLSSFAHLYKDVRDSLLCFNVSRSFCNPVNMVQNVFQNKAATEISYDVKSLSDYFEQGFRVDISKYTNFVPEGCHQEAELFFMESIAHQQNKNAVSSKHLPENPNDVLSYLKDRNLVKKGQIRLHLGCGEMFFEDYINIDYPPDHHSVMKIKAEAYADIMKTFFPQESVDEIRLHHVFEHFNRVTALALLIRWHSWLKVGGVLHIETPDLMGSAKTLVSDAPFDVKMATVRHLAGDQYESWGYHVEHWFPERYKVTLEQLGFDIINIRTWSWPQKPFLSNVEVIARKARHVEINSQLNAADALLWQSIVSPLEQPTYEVWQQQLRSILSGQANSNVDFSVFHKLFQN